jgi:hypothetical protein
MLRIPYRFCSAVVILGLCVGVPSSRATAQANLPLYEAFDYGAGNLVGNALEGRRGHKRVRSKRLRRSKYRMAR